MKKTLTFIAAMVLLAVGATAQNAQKLSYSAVVRDTDNKLVSNQSVTMAISIANSNGGAAVYSETHSATTNQNGLVTLTIGEGSNQQGSLSDVTWPTAFITTTCTLPGDAQITNTVPVNAVPYAFYADSVNPGALLNALASLTDEQKAALRDALGAVSYPTVTTAEATDITTSGATVGGTVISDGNATISERGIRYKTGNENWTSVSVAATDNTFSTTLANLAPNTTYTVQAYATSNIGTGYGDEVTFTTLAVWPSLTTAEATDITASGATVGGTITFDGNSTITARGIRYKTGNEDWTSVSVAATDNNFTTTLTGLTPNTTYTVQAFATNEAGTGYGDEVPFTTLVAKPTVTTDSVTSITTTEATVYGTIAYAGGGTISESGIRYKTGNEDWTVVNVTATDNNFSTTLTGLTPNTTYMVCAYATNEAGTSYGDTVTFTTDFALPTVTTDSVTSITTTEATVYGTIAYAGGGTISARGIRYKTGNNDWTEVSVTSSDNNFSTTLTGLTPNTAYTVQAYATNEAGIGYGSEVEFSTSAESTTPAGALTGVFTVSPTKQVYFSKGNLQYTKSTGVWSFMEHQYDMVESGGQNVGTDYANQDVVSLFGFGTSGWDHECSGAAYQPYSTAYDADLSWNVFICGPYKNGKIANLTGEFAQSDWGYNAISNGGNQAGMGWRTLTRSEWTYLIGFSNNSCRPGNRYMKARVNGANGIVVFPDGWNNPDNIVEQSRINNAGIDAAANAYDISNIWPTLEGQGAVFLPATGYRREAGIGERGIQGNYWSSTAKATNSSPNSVYYFGFQYNLENTYSVDPYGANQQSYYGHAVRLVIDKED